MMVKIHIAEGKKIISIADKDLIGKEFEEGEKYLNVSKQFYNGEEKNEEGTLELIRNATSLNIVGKNSIKFALKHNLVEKDSILKIDNIPCAIVIFYSN